MDSVSFTMEQGEIVGLIGPNGAGKTTLFEVITCFYPPSEGCILFKGERIDGLKPHQIPSKGIARSFQLFEALPSFTVFDFIMLSALQKVPLSQAKMQTEKTLATINLAHRKEYPVSMLPPGEQKLAEIGRVLNSQPEMMLLDECMAGMSDFEAESIMSLIRKLNHQGVTFLIVEHRLELIREMCHRIVVLNLGKKIAAGSPEEVMANEEVIKAYIGKEE